MVFRDFRSNEKAKLTEKFTLKHSSGVSKIVFHWNYQYFDAIPTHSKLDGSRNVQFWLAISLEARSGKNAIFENTLCICMNICKEKDITLNTYMHAYRVVLSNEKHSKFPPKKTRKTETHFLILSNSHQSFVWKNKHYLFIHIIILELFTNLR